MKQLRKCIGSADQFRYRVIRYELHPAGGIQTFDEFISCSVSSTSIRRLEENGNYEALVDGTWTRIGEDTFTSILHNHKKYGVIRRRSGRAVQKKEGNFKDVVKITNHLRLRLKERVMDKKDGLKSILAYVYDNGRIIPGYEASKWKSEVKKQILIYEPDTRIGMICDIQPGGKLVGITTYHFENPWFELFMDSLKQSGRSLSEFKTLKQYSGEIDGRNSL